MPGTWGAYPRNCGSNAPTAAIAAAAESIEPPIDGAGVAGGDEVGDNDGEATGDGLADAAAEVEGTTEAGIEGLDGGSVGEGDALGPVAPQPARTEESREMVTRKVPRARGPLPQERAARAPGRVIRMVVDEETFTGDAVLRRDRAPSSWRP
ncbi:MAG: hypothetical protein H0W07_09135 [Chloroflexi bacterium]|nr:hypothetical protein [Chloroflexota bacterium]